jgi:aspartyl-tRNA synthetase
MKKIVSSIPKESIVDVKGVVQSVPQSIESCTQSEVEISCTEFWVVSMSEPRLPLQIEDATRRVVEDVI